MCEQVNRKWLLKYHIFYKESLHRNLTFVIKTNGFIVFTALSSVMHKDTCGR